MQAASIGHRVPDGPFVGRVHSVFAHACNVAVHGELLTIAAATGGDAPTVLRLARDADADLRAAFAVGELVHGDPVTWRSARAALRRAPAAIWRPPAPRAWRAHAALHVRLEAARRSIAARLGAHGSVLLTAAAPRVDALALACRHADAAGAARHAALLLGWGEGLTPAGDDLLAGVLAGLEMAPLQVGADASRIAACARLRDAIAAVVLEHAARRTTTIAAYQLRLAAHGHHGAIVHALRDTLLAHDDARVEPTLRRALDVGATSGAATALGIVDALRAVVERAGRTPEAR